MGITDFFSISTGRYTFFTSGKYHYNCPGIGSGNVTVVLAKHNIPLCKQCTSGGGGAKWEEPQQHSINVGDVIQWTVAENEQTNCSTMLIRELMGDYQSMFFLQRL